MDTKLTATYTGKGVGSTAPQDKFVKLSQKAVGGVQQAANLSDIARMLIRAMSGLSARSYGSGGCPVRKSRRIVYLTLEFYSWPSALDMNYRVSVSIGTMGKWIRVDQQKEFDAVFELSDRVSLEYLPKYEKESDIGIEWQTPAINELGETVEYPDVTVDGNSLLADAEIFGVARVNCIAQGYSHKTVISFYKSTGEKYEDIPNVDIVIPPGRRISKISCAAMASWMDDGQADSTIIDLEIPDCVYDYLNTCPDGGFDWGGGVSADEDLVLVFYSTCTGKPILVTTE